MSCLGLAQCPVPKGATGGAGEGRSQDSPIHTADVGSVPSTAVLWGLRGQTGWWRSPQTV